MVQKPVPKKVPVLPKVLAYPTLHPLDTTLPLIRNRLCYVIRHYGTQGLSVLIARKPSEDKVAVLCGDWKGNNIDLVDETEPLVQAAMVFLREDLVLFLRVMQLTKLTQVQFFLALDGEGLLTLVDMQVSANKLAGPGFVKDFFGKIYRTQEIIKVEPIDDRAVEYLNKGTGSYEGDLILKTSKFSTFHSETVSDMPTYTEIKR